MMKLILVVLGVCSIGFAQIPNAPPNTMGQNPPAPPAFSNINDLNPQKFGQLCDSQPEACFSCVDDAASCQQMMPLCQGAVAAQCQNGYRDYEDCKFDNPGNPAACANKLKPPADAAKSACQANPASCAELIKASPAKPKAAGPAKAAACFHGSSIVQTESGFITIAQLAKLPSKGMKVLSWNPNTQKAEFSPIRGWIHSNPDQVMDFVELRTDKGKQLSLTPKHLIYRLPGCKSQELETVFADKIREGDCVQSGEDGEMERVSGVQDSVKTGIYSPITEQGSIVVDKLVASCYSFNEDESLQRILYGLLFTARDLVQPFLPSNIHVALFGSHGVENTKSQVVLALDSLQKYFY